eukprot:15506-Heterococcus_DN1.PRE.1
MYAHLPCAAPADTDTSQWIVAALVRLLHTLQSPYSLQYRDGRTNEAMRDAMSERGRELNVVVTCAQQVLQLSSTLTVRLLYFCAAAVAITAILHTTGAALYAPNADVQLAS